MPSSAHNPDSNSSGYQTTSGAGDDMTHPSWTKVCAQHESVLTSHIETLNQVKEHTSPDSDAFRMIASMVEKTGKLMTQFQVMKKQLGQQTFHSDSHRHHESKSTNGTSDTRHRPKDRMKRDRMTGNDTVSESEGADPSSSNGVRSQKRKKLDASKPGDDEDVRNVTPVSLETEDISEEVQRRLAIKEEQRKKRDSKPKEPKSEKRKRESMESTGSRSSAGGTTRPEKKKAKRRRQTVSSTNE